MDLSLFRNKNFSILICGQLISVFGNNIQNFALSLYVLSVTKSTAQFASVLVMTMVPKILFGPMAGVFVDRWDRKKLVILLDLLCGTVTLIAAIQFYLNGGLGLIEIYILAVVFSLIGIFFEPAMGTIIPSIIEKDKLIQANTLTSLMMSSANLLAPMISGMLYGIYGLFVILVFNAITFFVSSACEMMLSLPKRERKSIERKASFKVEFVEGLRYIKGNSVLVNMILMGLVINFVYTPIMSVGTLFISKSVFNVSDSSVGLLQSSLVVASLVSPIIISIVSKRLSLVKMYLFSIAVIAFDLAMIAFVTSSLAVGYGISGYGGFLLMGGFIFFNALMVGLSGMSAQTFLQKETPNEMLGRVTSLKSTLTLSIIPAGQILYGFLFEYFEAWQCVLLSSVTIFIILLTLGRRLLDIDQRNNRIAVETA